MLFIAVGDDHIHNVQHATPCFINVRIIHQVYDCAGYDVRRVSAIVHVNYCTVHGNLVFYNLLCHTDVRNSKKSNSQQGN